MGNITSFNQQNPEQWRQQNEEVLNKINDDAGLPEKRIEVVINAVRGLTEEIGEENF